MELAAPRRPSLKPAMKPSWNPLRLRDAALPVPLLLSAKLIAVTLLATGHVGTLPDPFLPFLPVFDRIAAPAHFRTALQVLFLVGSVSLLFNRRVRLASFVVGATILVGIASSRIYWANNTFFCGAFLTLIGLYASNRSVWLLRAQVALIYFGAGLNKALDPDWLSGQFFENWAVVNLEHDLYTRLSALLPPLALSRLMCWATIATELSLFVGFTAPRLWPFAIWLGILFHAAMTVFTGITFVLFLYVAPAAYFAFVRWPQATTEVLYDGDCGICAKTKRWFEALDFDGAFRWTAYQSGIGARFGIGADALRKRLHLVTDGRHLVADGRHIAQGFHAFKRMLLSNPVTHFLMLGVLLSLHWGPAWARSAAILGMIGFFFPAFDRIGQAAYDLIARNRNRLGSAPTCAVEGGPP